MLTSLEKLHDVGFVHCDIKPENFVMKGRDQVILIDFGLSHRYISPVSE